MRVSRFTALKVSGFTAIVALLVASLSFVVVQSTGLRGGDDSGDTILLESFDNPKHEWKQMNDPVMGGKSTGSFSIANGMGVFEGEVVNVPFLDAPGFIQARTVDDVNSFPDVSSCSGLELVVKSTTDYSGYRFSFGSAHAPGGRPFAFGYKTNLENVPIAEFGSIVLPFDKFTDFWDDATGDAIRTCQDDEKYCPDELTLKNLHRMTIWAEGVAGKVSIEIKTISAVGCKSES
jgi:hypothetical protein